MKEFQTSYSRRRFLSAITMTAGAGMILRSPSAWAAGVADAHVSKIVAATIGIDTHNHIDVPLTTAEMPGPDVDLASEMKRSGLSAICMTFATDYQRGDAYDRFLKGMASMDRQLERNHMKRSLTPAEVRTAHKHGRPTVIQAIEGAHFLEGHVERVEEAYHRGLRQFGLLHDSDASVPLEMFTPSLRALADSPPSGRKLSRNATGSAFSSILLMPIRKPRRWH
jgi:membrane dipeptidase